MNIFINGRFLTQDLTGVQRFAFEALNALDQLNLPWSMTLLVPPGTDCSALQLRHVQIRQVGSRQGHAWEQLDLPRFCRDGLLLNLCNTAPAFKRRQIVTIHDAAVHAVPQAYSRSFRAAYKTLLPLIGKQARRVLTVSQFSAGQLTRYFGVHPDKIRVLKEGGEHVLTIPADTGVLHKHALTQRPYLLAVSSLSPNKNFGAVIEAIRLMDKPNFDFVIAGGANPAVFNQGLGELPPFVKYVGRVSDAELRALYEHAALFVYPSFYEGFGLPPLEAMNCGCPVLVSNAASLPEVCGDAAIYCDPQRPADIAQQIARIMADVTLQAQLRAAGPQQAKRFGWPLAAQQIVDVIKELEVL